MGLIEKSVENVVGPLLCNSAISFVEIAPGRKGP
jgi:hypothetical protein